MKMQILRDTKGEIIAACDLAPTAPAVTEPEVARGQELVEADVPEEYLKMPAQDFIKRLNTDIKSKRLAVVKPKR